MDAAVVAAIIAAAVAVLAFVGDRLLEGRERKRKLAAEALSDALQWIEAPYRIRRRADDDPSTLANLTDGMNDLQQKLAFNASWLRLEIPNAYGPYAALVQLLKERAKPSMQEAWRSPPARQPEEMNVGPLFKIDAVQESEEYVEAVRRSLRLLPWPW